MYYTQLQFTYSYVANLLLNRKVFFSLKSWKIKYNTICMVHTRLRISKLAECHQ